MPLYLSRVYPPSVRETGTFDVPRQSRASPLVQPPDVPWKWLTASRMGSLLRRWSLLPTSSRVQRRAPACGRAATLLRLGAASPVAPCRPACRAPSDASSAMEPRRATHSPPRRDHHFARATHEPLPWPVTRGCTIHPGTNRARTTRTAAVLRLARAPMRRATCLPRLGGRGVLKPHALLSAAAFSAAGAKRARY